MKVFIVNGHGGSGKTTFEQMVADNYDGFVKVLSTITPIKQIALKVGWNGVKDAAGRRLLSDLKDALTRYNDYPFRWICDELEEWEEDMMEEIWHTDDAIVFIDCREPEEIQRLIDKFNAKSIIVERDTNENFTNHADQEVDNFSYDIHIVNNGTLDDLDASAQRFIEYIKNL